MTNASFEPLPLHTAPIGAQSYTNSFGAPVVYKEHLNKKISSSRLALPPNFPQLFSLHVGLGERP